MGMTIVLRKIDRGGEAATRLCRRYHDLSGTDYEGMATLTLDEGLGLASSGLHFINGPEVPGEVRETRLSIRLRDDPVPNARLWELSAQMDGLDDRLVGYIDCEMVRDLMNHRIRLNFPDGEPDWEAVDDLKVRLQIRELRDRADALEAGLPAKNSIVDCVAEP